MGPRAGLDGSEKILPYTGIRSQGRPARSESAIPTELFRPSELSPVRRTSEQILVCRTLVGGGTLITLIPHT